ncbi:MFS transporter, partial [Kitasatospora sp. NPDC058965]|uniref:MFS transporter n=1 Tax=Kitasatospora sp. NPDC058965 TaxID=3346682 RepID=UPI0036C0C0A6
MTPPHALRRVPGLLPLFLTALVARLSYGTVSLSMVLTVRHTTGSYAAVGAVLALFGLTAAALGPVRAGLVERHGVRRVLPPLAVLYCAGLAVLACAGPRWLPVAAALTGAVAPPVGPVVRARWSELLGSGPLLERAFSVDAVAEELLYVAGPLLVALVGAGGGLLLTGVLLGTGVAGLAALSPEPGRPGTARGSVPGRVPGIGRPVLVAGAAGLALGAVSVLLVAVAAGSGALPWLEAALAAGSAAGGLAHGAVRWRATAGARLTVAGAGLGLGVAALGCAPDLGWLLAGVAFLGVFVSPGLAGASVGADRR